jgi:hypothetical protein
MDATPLLRRLDVIFAQHRFFKFRVDVLTQSEIDVLVVAGVQDGDVDGYAAGFGCGEEGLQAILRGPVVYDSV